MYIEYDIKKKFNEIYKQYNKNNKLPSFINENNDNIFSYIYLARCFLPINNICLLGD